MLEVNQKEDAQKENNMKQKKSASAGGKKIHTITAEWLFKKLKYSGEPRMVIKRKYLWCWDKDQWGDEKPVKYPFVGRCQNQYAFQIECIGEKCGWIH